VADVLSQQGERKVLKKTRTTTIVEFTKGDLVATYEQYYDDKTITVKGAGKVHYSMQKNQSYYDINVDDLKVIEKKLGINRSNKDTRENHVTKPKAA
jgi:hypothetical protein